MKTTLYDRTYYTPVRGVIQFLGNQGGAVKTISTPGDRSPVLFWGRKEGLLVNHETESKLLHLAEQVPVLLAAVEDLARRLEKPDPRSYMAKPYWTPEELAHFLGRSRQWIWQNWKVHFAQAVYRIHEESNKLLFKRDIILDLLERNKEIKIDMVQDLSGKGVRFERRAR